MTWSLFEWLVLTHWFIIRAADGLYYCMCMMSPLYRSEILDLNESTQARRKNLWNFRRLQFLISLPWLIVLVRNEDVCVGNKRRNTLIVGILKSQKKKIRKNYFLLAEKRNYNNFPMSCLNYSFFAVISWPRTRNFLCRGQQLWPRHRKFLVRGQQFLPETVPPPLTDMNWAEWYLWTTGHIYMYRRFHRKSWEKKHLLESVFWISKIHNFVRITHNC